MNELITMVVAHPYASSIIGLGGCAIAVMVWRHLPQEYKNVVKEFIKTCVDIRKFFRSRK